MKIISCPNAFKESLSSLKASESISRGIHKILPKCRVENLPIADGGDGTLETILNNIGGSLIKCKVTDPLGKPIKADFGITKDRKTAFIEMATASGLKLVQPQKRNPFITTTYGTGELIKTALNRGVKKIIIGIGGSATVDGGVGIIQALSGRFLDKNGREIGRGGGALSNLLTIDLSRLDARIKKCEILVASDVENKLLGPNGAARAFGPQKGADEKAVLKLEENLSHLAYIVKKDLGVDIRTIKGGGAAGGVGASLVAFLGAKIVPGIDVILKYSRFKERIRGASLLITGEGKFDETTLDGKAPYKVIIMAKKMGIAIGVICGKYTLQKKWHKIDFIEEILPRASSLEDAIKNAHRYIEECATSIVARFVRMHSQK